MSFTGIPDDALEFYEGLEADNSKAYWGAHKHVYDTAVRAPLVALCEALAPEFGEVYLFRPYRDIRFSNDKSPYKTAQGGTVGPHYVHIGASGLFVAAGYYRMAPDQVARYRDAVDDDTSGPALEAEVDRLRSVDVTVDGDALKTKPRGFPADHPRIELLRFRSLAGRRDLGAPDWLSTPAAVDHVAEVWRELGPLREWLDRYVGSSRDEGRRSR